MKATQDITRRQRHRSQIPLTITPQCVMGVGPDLVTPSVGYDQSKSDERAFSHIQSDEPAFSGVQSGDLLSEAVCTQSAIQESFRRSRVSAP